MAVQSEIFSTEYGVRSFISTKHIATKQHMSVWLQRRSDNIWVQLSISNYELINNSAVLTQAPNSITYSKVEIRVADTPDELGSSQSEISIVAGLYDEIVALNGIKNDITTVASMSGDVTTVSSNISDINSVVTNIVPNLNEILQADTNATIATTKAAEASYYATITNYAIVETLAELEVLDTTQHNNICVVKDLDRGGTFIWSATGTANGGTVFAGATGYWTRQYSGAVNIKWFGAKGDGVTDDTVPIQNAIDFCDDVTGSNSSYFISSNTISITNKITLKDMNIKINSGFTAINITHSNVTIDNVNIDGTSKIPYAASGVGIRISGVDNGASMSPTYISNVVIKNCSISNMSFIGIKPTYVDNLIVDSCELFDISYAGFGASSCNNSIVKNCNIYGITITSPAINAYGGYWSQVNSSDAVRYPICEYCKFDNNRVDGVNWEGLDTHGGKEIHFINNYLSNCANAIAIIVADDETKSYRTATIRNVVSGNTIINCTVGVGVSNTLGSGKHHTQLSIVNNNFKGCGRESAVSGAISLKSTMGAIVSNNQISSQLVNGVISQGDNVNCNITDNVFSDVYSTVYTSSAINIKDEIFSGVVSGNVCTIYNDTLLNLFGRGLAIGITLVNIKISMGINNFRVATIPYNITDLIASQITVPNVYSNQIIIPVTTETNSVTSTIMLDNPFSSNTLYDVVASISSSTQKNVRVRATRIATNSFSITAETLDGLNFTTAGSISCHYIASGF